jgi:hypothetical protein
LIVGRRDLILMEKLMLRKRSKLLNNKSLPKLKLRLKQRKTKLKKKPKGKSERPKINRLLIHKWVKCKLSKQELIKKRNFKNLRRMLNLLVKRGSGKLLRI